MPEGNSKRLNLREQAARILYRASGSKFEQTLTLYQQAREFLPDRYRELLRLRPPAVLKINLRNAYPRCHVTRRIRADEGFYFGPFASRRSAEAFSEGFLDLFKIRRCQIKIRRDPNFPGCIYSEMKMCLAPCFAGCTKEEYDAEVALVVETLDTAGDALTGKVEREREAASEALDFERAAALHKRLEKVDAALRGLPELARRVEELDAVILQRGNDERTIAVFPLVGGTLAEPIFLNFADSRASRVRWKPSCGRRCSRRPRHGYRAKAGNPSRQICENGMACMSRRRNCQSTCRLWRGGFIRSRGTAKSFSVKTTGHIAASCALAAGFLAARCAPSCRNRLDS